MNKAERVDQYRLVSAQVLADVLHQINSGALTTALKHETENDGEEPKVFDALVELRDSINQRAGRCLTLRPTPRGKQ